MEMGEPTQYTDYATDQMIQVLNSERSRDISLLPNRLVLRHNKCVLGGQEAGV